MGNEIVEAYTKCYECTDFTNKTFNLNGKDILPMGMRGWGCVTWKTCCIWERANRAEKKVYFTEKVTDEARLCRSTCAMCRDLDFNSIATGKPLKMLYAINTMTIRLLLLGGSLTVYKKKLDRVRNGGSQLENYNNQNEREYVHKIHNHQLLRYEIKVFSFLPWKNVLWIQNNSFPYFITVPKYMKSALLLFTYHKITKFPVSYFMEKNVT